ncbi:hypothetical protein J7L02_03025 [Candidatus Woesearchaeota archaeon]|nr:hypothetical protein [Candidatus Woesearchaeota archaeon]
METSDIALRIANCVQEKRELSMHQGLALKIGFKVLEQAKNLRFEKQRDFKTLCKQARMMARQLIGAFFKPKYWRLKKGLLKKMCENPLLIAEDCLKLYSSSNERLMFYDEVYSKIFSRSSENKDVAIIDIGTGFNVFSLKWLLNYARVKHYFAIDASLEVFEIVSRFSECLKSQLSQDKQRSVSIQPMLEDVSSIEFLKRLQALFKNLKAQGFDREYVYCFLFKTLDGVEFLNPGFSLKLLQELVKRCVVIVSFSKQSLSGKVFKFERFWFSKLLKKLGVDCYEFTIPGELFFVLKRIE